MTKITEAQAAIATERWGRNNVSDMLALVGLRDAGMERWVFVSANVDDGIDAIAAALNAREDALRAEGCCWIACSERAPDKPGWYIGYWNGEVQPLRFGGQYWTHTKLTRDCADPTHWREMPEAP